MTNLLVTLSILVLTLNSSTDAYYIISPSQTLGTPTPTIHHRAEGDAALKAVEPTKAGQIGVNPVLFDLGDADTYMGQIYGTDTKYITVNEPDTTTKVIDYTHP